MSSFFHFFEPFQFRERVHRYKFFGVRREGESFVGPEEIDGDYFPGVMVVVEKGELHLYGNDADGDHKTEMF